MLAKGQEPQPGSLALWEMSAKAEGTGLLWFSLEVPEAVGSGRHQKLQPCC